MPCRPRNSRKRSGRCWSIESGMRHSRAATRPATLSSPRSAPRRGAAPVPPGTGGLRCPPWSRGDCPSREGSARGDQVRRRRWRAVDGREVRARLHYRNGENRPERIDDPDLDLCVVGKRGRTVHGKLAQAGIDPGIGRERSRRKLPDRRASGQQGLRHEPPRRRRGRRQAQPFAGMDLTCATRRCRQPRSRMRMRECSSSRSV